MNCTGIAVRAEFAINVAVGNPVIPIVIPISRIVPNEKTRPTGR